MQLSQTNCALSDNSPCSQDLAKFFNYSKTTTLQIGSSHDSLKLFDQYLISSARLASIGYAIAWKGCTLGRSRICTNNQTQLLISQILTGKYATQILSHRIFQKRTSLDDSQVKILWLKFWKEKDFPSEKIAMVVSDISRSPTSTLIQDSIFLQLNWDTQKEQVTSYEGCAKYCTLQEDFFFVYLILPVSNIGL